MWLLRQAALCCSQMYSKGIGQLLAHNSYLINICRISKSFPRSYDADRIIILILQKMKMRHGGVSDLPRVLALGIRLRSVIHFLIHTPSDFDLHKLSCLELTALHLFHIAISLSFIEHCLVPVLGQVLCK